MKQPTTIFSCSNCDAQFQKWVGRCTQCGKWSTVTQQANPSNTQTNKTTYPPLPVEQLKETKEKEKRITTGIDEFDRILGGGIVSGEILVLGGEPGIGKSTLVLQIAAALSKNEKVLYLSGEESNNQIADRARRLTLKTNNILMINDTRIEYVCSTIEHEKPKIAIIDSINTVSSLESEGVSGSVTQVKACAAKLTEVAKKTGVPILLIAHVNKEGNVAGPKTLEHVVDAIFLLEGDRSGQLRLLRALKNRFGAVSETGVFVMKESGLEEVSNPSALLLAERSQQVPGTMVTTIMEGTRALLLEVQSLVSRTNFGMPARKASGVDSNRLQIILAVLSRRLGLPFDSHDVFVNVSGGIKLNDRSSDLALAVSLISALHDKVIANNIIAIGEIGLGGEVRSVPHLGARIKEAEKLGFTYALIPNTTEKISSTMKIVPVKNVEELVHTLLKDKK